MSKHQPLERRDNLSAELRLASEGDVRNLVGYAAVFETPTDIGPPGRPWFREKIRRGAFADAIANDDVRALINHDSNLVLGRNKSGTLTLAEDERGLKAIIAPADTSYFRDLAVSMDRGDIDKMSFQFIATREEWDETGPVPVRTLLAVRLYDVAVVTFPAYEDTSVSLRSTHEAFQARPIVNRLVAPNLRRLMQRQAEKYAGL